MLIFLSFQNKIEYKVQFRKILNIKIIVNKIKIIKYEKYIFLLQKKILKLLFRNIFKCFVDIPSYKNYTSENIS